MLAQVTALLLARGAGYFHGRAGLYHLAGGGYASRYEWAEQILKLDPRASERVTPSLERAATAGFPAPTERPLFFALDCSKFEETFGLKLPEWKISPQLIMKD